MTCDRFKGKVGYQGQSHLVLATDEHGKEFIIGWQNSADPRHWDALAKAWGLTNLRAVPCDENGEPK